MRYPLATEKWRTTPLETGFPDDDSGYREVALRSGHEVELLEVTECIVREIYTLGCDIQGNPDESLRLPGGLKGGKVFGVATVVRGIHLANKLLREISDGEFQLVVLEVLRTRKRQRKGHGKTFLQMLASAGITEPTPGEVLTYGRKADCLFSYTPPDTTTAKYKKLLKRLQSKKGLVSQLRDAAQLSNEAAIDDVLSEYISIIASLDIREAVGAGLEMPASHMVHGGGAFDVLIADKKGRALSVTPYDYFNAPEMVAYRFTEDDSNHAKLLEQAGKDPILAKHFQGMGYSTPSEFTLGEWTKCKEANRMLVRLVIAMGGSTYSDEHWHNEFGTRVLNLEGQVAIEDPLAAQFPKSGGPGYTVINSGRSGTAVWHTAVTEAALRRLNLLEE